MKSISSYLFRRGAAGTLYFRQRIPTALLAAYPGKSEIVRSLRTSDMAEGRRRCARELSNLETEFQTRARELQPPTFPASSPKEVPMTDALAQSLGQYWMRHTLLADIEARSQGIDADTFREQSSEITEQLQELSMLLAQGNTRPILRVLHTFIHLCGLSVSMTPEEEQRAAYIFLESVVASLEHIAARQAGKRVNTDEVAPDVPHPASALVDTSGPTWAEVYDLWANFVDDRPKATLISYQTAWRQLVRFADSHKLAAPKDLTPELVAEFVESMKASGLKVKTVNGRLTKIKGIFKIAVGRCKLATNPAADALGYKASAREKGMKRRLPWSEAEVQTIFGSPIFMDHLRSSGQSGEASYWIPLIMYYTGARPEEIAGLDLDDIKKDEYGWYFNITDLDENDDVDLFDEEENATATEEERKRRLKNTASRRRIPLAQELEALGLFRYIDWVRAQGKSRLFPTLERDFHGKLSGAFSKFFGRYKRHTLGFTSEKKVLYSFRHTMKDMLEEARVPSKYLKRLLGHTTGDGYITDGYGSDLPPEQLHEYFARVKFYPIPAKPWQRGTGRARLIPWAPDAKERETDE